MCSSPSLKEGVEEERIRSLEERVFSFLSIPFLFPQLKTHLLSIFYSKFI
jgi:hypothetical protein